MNDWERISQHAWRKGRYTIASVTVGGVKQWTASYGAQEDDNLRVLGARYLSAETATRACELDETAQQEIAMQVSAP